MVKKEKTCAVCGATGDGNKRKFRIVAGPNVKIWGKLVDTKLYPGDRICGHHMPTQWKKKVDSLDLTDADDDDSTRTEEFSSSKTERRGSGSNMFPGMPYGMMMNPMFMPTPMQGSRFRVHANEKGSGRKFVVPIDPLVTVRELGEEIAIRYGHFRNKGSSSKQMKYDVVELEDLANSGLWLEDVVADVLDNNAIVRFSAKKSSAPPSLSSTPPPKKKKKALEVVKGEPEESIIEEQEDDNKEDEAEGDEDESGVDESAMPSDEENEDEEDEKADEEEKPPKKKSAKTGKAKGEKAEKASGKKRKASQEQDGTKPAKKAKKGVPASPNKVALRKGKGE